MNFLLLLLFFILELINSFCADNRGKWVVRANPQKADIYDFISSSITVAIPFVIFVVEKDWRYGIPVIIASVIGTHLATIGFYLQKDYPFYGWKHPFWGKKGIVKQKFYRRRNPFTTA